jgi:hypothetical protein
MQGPLNTFVQRLYLPLSGYLANCDIRHIGLHLKVFCISGVTCLRSSLTNEYNHMQDEPPAIDVMHQPPMYPCPWQYINSEQC